MGKRGKWFSAVKKVFTQAPESHEQNGQKSKKSRKKWRFGKSKRSDPLPAESLENTAPDVALPSPPQPPQDIRVIDVQNQENKRAYSVAAAAAVAAEAAAVAAQAAAEVARLTTQTRYTGKSREEIAAIKIQAAFRGYMARRTLRALKGLARLRSRVDGNAVKRQAAATLRSMQTLARVQSQIRSRRIRMAEENQALQRQLQQKRERELEKMKIGEEWDDSPQSKEQIEAKMVNRQEAALRRERALAYAFSHQWQASSRQATPMFTDPNNPHWGWSWLERWMAARPWETRTAMEANETASVKSASHSVGGEKTKAYARRDANLEVNSPTAKKSSRPPSRRSPSTPPSKTSSVTVKKSGSPRASWTPTEDDSRSVASMQSERPRRHSIGGSSMRDDVSLASTPAIPTYMVPTEAARARSRFHNNPSPSKERAVTPDSVSVGPAKKRLSFTGAGKTGATTTLGRARRQSGPPKLETGSVKDITVGT